MSLKHQYSRFAKSASQEKSPKEPSPHLEISSPAESVETKIARSGKRVMYSQRIDTGILEAFRSLPGSPAHNLEKAMREYLERRA